MVPTTVAVLLVIHFIGDFVVQTDRQALHKSKWGEAFRWKQPNFTGLSALLSHTGLYALCFLPFGWRFALVTFVLHTLTDAVTSRITSRLWFIDLRPFAPEEAEALGFEDGEWDPSKDFIAHLTTTRHNFFVMIGFDQLLHYFQLIFTIYFLRG